MYVRLVSASTVGRILCIIDIVESLYPRSAFGESEHFMSENTWPLRRAREQKMLIFLENCWNKFGLNISNLQTPAPHKSCTVRVFGELTVGALEAQI
jgi:hypothetical protein